MRWVYHWPTLGAYHELSRLALLHSNPSILYRVQTGMAVSVAGWPLHWASIPLSLWLRPSRKPSTAAQHLGSCSLRGLFLLGTELRCQRGAGWCQ